MTASSSSIGLFETRPHAAHPSQAPHLARWPYGHRAFFAFQATKMRSHCFLRLHAVYDAEGASHDVVEQGFHDQDTGAHHSCTGRRGHYEGGKSALRL